MKQKIPNNRQTGSYYERQAALFLEQQGFQIVEQNYRNRRGEIDIIAREGNYLVFVEVKYRKNQSLGYPEEAVHSQKQHKIRCTASYYLYSCHYHEETPRRFDVVSIVGEEILLIRDAF